MKITKVRVRKLTGTMETNGPFWEERLLRPIDIYPEYRRQGRQEGGEQVDDKHLRMVQYYVDIETDEGIVGRAGPVWPDAARMVLTQLTPIIMGKDPRAIELLWDQMHRLQVHGRQGDAMVALSAVDCALWDILALSLKAPAWRLLGGPTRDSIPAYVSMLGYAVEDLGKVRERAARYKEMGFTAQKWFIRHGPMSGHEGMRKNVDLIRTIRETVGEDYDIMIDCWQSLNLDY